MKDCGYVKSETNYGIKIAISFHHISFLVIVIHFLNEIVISRTKHNLRLKWIRRKMVNCIKQCW
jgi:hypothetical protein